MKARAWLACAAATLALFVRAAHARERDAADVVVPARPFELGYQLEMGIASTRVANGVPRYSDETVPANENKAALAFRNVGPGELRLSTSIYTALADHARQPPSALEIVPGASYGGRAGPFGATIGYAAHLMPRAVPVDAAHHVLGNVRLDGRGLGMTIDLAAEVVRQRSIYASFGIESTAELGRVTLTPRASVGAKGVAGADVHLHDVTIAIVGKLALTSDVYVSVRPAYSVALAPASTLPDPSFAGRSTPHVLVAFGVQR